MCVQRWRRLKNRCYVCAMVEEATPPQDGGLPSPNKTQNLKGVRGFDFWNYSALHTHHTHTTAQLQSYLSMYKGCCSCAINKANERVNNANTNSLAPAKT